ncbi:unnamed protein product [Rotaria sp. Silwood1]|nr:unnamed protein product [Rotaria sp. Silwood1]
MTYPKKQLHVACNYLLRLMKAHVELSNEQINLFKRTFHDILSKRFINHWFPATPNRGSAYRCLQTKHWKDPVLRSIAEHPGEVAVCFGDEGTWCPLYKHDIDGQIHQEYSDGEETVSSDDDLISLTKNIKTLNVNDRDISTKENIDSNISRSSSSSIESSSRASSPLYNTISTNTQIQSHNDYHNSGSNLYSYQFLSNDWNEQQNIFWPQQLTMSDSFLLYNQRENF